MMPEDPGPQTPETQAPAAECATATQNGAPLARARRGDLLLVALLEGATIGEAAIRAGVSRSTALRWRQTPDFQERLRDARGELLAGAITRLHKYAGDWADVLHKTATSQGSRGCDRIAAAKSGLELLFRSVEAIDREQRLTAVERAITAGKEIH